MKTSNNDFEGISARLNNETLVHLLHGAVGIAGESGELLDTVKKHIYYGKDLDIANIVEELGDVLWFVGKCCDSLGLELNDVMSKNIEKLNMRYGDCFTEERALNRNVRNERRVIDVDSIDFEWLDDDWFYDVNCGVYHE